MSDLPMRAQLAVALGRTASKMSRLAGRGDGSVIGGKIGLKLDPDLLTRLAANRKLVLVSATNGKTTTTRLIASAMSGLGEVATNAFGANMPTGHVSALAAAPAAKYGVLECDEKYVPMVLRETGANVVLLMNLSRDQMDRAGEIWQLAGKWRKALDGADTPARHVGRADRQERHLGIGRPALARGLLVLPRVRRPARPGGHQLGLPAVQLRPPQAGVDPARQPGHHARRQGAGSAAQPAWPGEPLQRGDGAGGGGTVRGPTGGGDAAAQQGRLGGRPLHHRAVPRP